MLRKVLTGLALWLSALGLAPLALGTGIPVVDALLNSTATVQLHQQITTATQNVAQTLKQIDQYAQQVRQYGLASAASLLLAGVLMALTLVQLTLMRRSRG